MNGVNGAAHEWRETRAPDGRVYYYNSRTNQTQWTKPDVLRIMNRQPWREYTAPDGRKYWANSETKQSVWAMPAEFKAALDEADNIPPERPPPQSYPPAAVTPGGMQQQQQQQQQDYGPPRRRDDDRNYSDRQPPFAQNESMRSSFVPAGANEPEYRSGPEAQEAFFKMLKSNGVQLDWTWDQTMRKCVPDPQFRAVKDPRDRRQAFEQYIKEQREQNKERERDRLAKARADFLAMLATHDEIKHYTRYKTAKPIIASETVFRSINDDDERRAFFGEYIAELKKRYTGDLAVQRKSAMDDLRTMLGMLDIKQNTSWNDAVQKIKENERFNGDAKFRTLTPTDILTQFEHYIRTLERTAMESKKKRKADKAHLERRTRANFVALIDELREAGRVHASARFMDVYPLMESDERYKNLLGQAGSTPLDYFWDAVEEDEINLRELRNSVLDVLDDNRFEIQPSTSLSSFMSMLSSDSRTSSAPARSLETIFNRIQDKISRRLESEAHAHDRAQRHAIDALRSRIKRLSSPPVTLTTSFDELAPRLERYGEWADVTSDDGRRQALEKHKKRLKEKEEEDALREERRRARRERIDERASLDGRRRPVRYDDDVGVAGAPREVDAYEADRRRAQDQRERSYRGREERRDDRRELDDRSRDAGGRRGSGRLGSAGAGAAAVSYEQERDERAREREGGNFLRRSTGAGAGIGSEMRELDYGDSGPGSMSERSGGGRKRRESSASEVGGQRKKAKREEDAEGAEAGKEQQEKQELEELKSGSEEGEIEE